MAPVSPPLVAPIHPVDPMTWICVDCGDGRCEDCLTPRCDHDCQGLTDIDAGPNSGPTRPNKTPKAPDLSQ